MFSQASFGGVTKEGPNRVSMKTDIQKAYNTVNWKFLEVDLKGFGFHEKMVHWVMSCVTTASFSICVNGESYGYFKDDLLIFCHGAKSFVSVFKEVIEEFGTIYGLLPNYSKSTIIFRSMSMEDQQEILECVPFQLEKPLVRYLGTVIKDINKPLKSFLWSQGESSKGKAKGAWKNIYRPKAMGGLGLKDLTRDEGRRFIVLKIGNGEKASVIYDNWCGVGILQFFITNRDLYNARRNANMIVKYIVENGSCKWPEDWIVKYLILAVTSDNFRNF
ncbi:RNA-directed DNA polymerase, eukaryota, reverse transcriptase zinc-binding domain protein [Tanacetum coccineum]